MFQFRWRKVLAVIGAAALTMMALTLVAEGVKYAIHLQRVEAADGRWCLILGSDSSIQRLYGSDCDDGDTGLL